MNTGPRLRLNNGIEMPALGLGLFLAPAEETTGAVVTAIYILFGNLPFLIIQRYNRPRLQKLLAAQQRRSRRNQEEQQ